MPLSRRAARGRRAAALLAVPHTEVYVHDLRRSLPDRGHQDHRAGRGNRRELSRLRRLLRRLPERRFSDGQKGRRGCPDPDSSPLRHRLGRVDCLPNPVCARQRIGRPHRAVPRTVDRGAVARTPPPRPGGDRDPRTSVRGVPVRARGVPSGRVDPAGAASVRARGPGARCDPEQRGSASQWRRGGRTSGDATRFLQIDARARIRIRRRLCWPVFRDDRGRRSAGLSRASRSARREREEVSAPRLPERVSVARSRRAGGPERPIVRRLGDERRSSRRALGSARSDTRMHGVWRLRHPLPHGGTECPLGRRRVPSDVPAVGVHQLSGLRRRVRASSRSRAQDRQDGFTPRHRGDSALRRSEGHLPILRRHVSGERWRALSPVHTPTEATASDSCLIQEPRPCLRYQRASVSSTIAFSQPSTCVLPRAVSFE